MTESSGEELSIEPAKEQVIYTGYFVDDPDELRSRFPSPPTHVNPYAHHITIAFKPENGTKGVQVGRKVPLNIIGRVTTKAIDALLVAAEIDKENPHITLATAEGVKPVASNNAIVEALINETVLEADGIIATTEGYFNGRNDVTTPSRL